MFEWIKDWFYRRRYRQWVARCQGLYYDPYLLSYMDIWRGEEYTDVLGQRWRYNGMWYEVVD